MSSSRPTEAASCSHAKLIRLRMPRRPPRQVALGCSFAVQISLTTDLGDPYWPEDFEELPLKAEIVDFSHEPMAGYSVELMPASIYKTGSIFHSIDVTVRTTDRKGKGREGVHLRVRPALRTQGKATAEQSPMNWHRDLFLVSESLALFAAVAGPLTLTRSLAHSKDKVEMTEQLLTLGEPIALSERPEHGLGSHIWGASLLFNSSDPAQCKADASLVLAMHLLAEKMPQEGQVDILEIGAGLGVASVAALARHRQAQCWLTDTQEVIEAATRPMIERLSANMRERMRAEILEWSTTPQLPAFVYGEHPLLVLAADVVYNSSLLPALAQTLSACLRARKRTTGLLAYRPRADTEAFFDMLRDLELDATPIQSARYDDIQVYRLQVVEMDHTMQSRS